MGNVKVGNVPVLQMHHQTSFLYDVYLLMLLFLPALRSKMEKFQIIYCAL